MKLEFSRQIFEKHSNFKFHENLSSESRVVSCGQTAGRTDRQTDMVMLIFAYVNFANVSESAARCFVSLHVAIYRNVTSPLGENLLYTTYGSPVG
jgi:hypothetical protein